MGRGTGAYRHMLIASINVILVYSQNTSAPSLAPTAAPTVSPTTGEFLASSRPTVRTPAITFADVNWIGNDLVNKLAGNWLEKQGTGKYNIVPSERRHTITSAPYDPAIDFAICWEGERCRGNSTGNPNKVDGGSLGIMVQQKWLVPSYMSNMSLETVCKSLKVDTDCNGIQACTYSTSAKKCEVKSSVEKTLKFPDFSSDTLTLTDLQAMNQALFLAMNGKLLTPPPEYYNNHEINDQIISDHSLSLTTSDETDFEALREVLVLKLKQRLPFIVHATVPSYISANFDNPADPMPIAMFHHLNLGNSYFPTAGHPATIVYSQAFATNNAAARKVLQDNLAGKMGATDLEDLILRTSKLMNFKRDSETIIWKQSVEEAVREYLCETKPNLGYCPKNYYPFYGRFPRKKDPFFPQELIVAVATCEPFTTCTCDVINSEFSSPFSKKSCTATGYSIDHLHEVMNMIGYNPSDITITCAPAGAPEGNEQAQTLVRKGLADIATGCVSAVDHEKTQVVDATSAFYASGLNVMILKPPPTDDIFKFMAPFSLGMWLLYLAFGVVFAFLGAMFENAANRGNYPFFFMNPRGYPDIFIYGLAILVDPAVGDKGQATTAGRVLKSVTSFCVIIILTVYTGQTAAALTAVTLDIEINSLDDLLGRDVAVADPSQQSYKFMNYYYGAKGQAEGRTLNGGAANLVSKGSFTDMVAALDEGEVEAIVFDDPVLQFFSKDEANGCAYLMPIEMFAATGFGMVVKKGDPMGQAISEVIALRSQNSEDDQLKQKYFGESCPEEEGGSDVVDIDGYYGVMVVFACCVLFCTIVAIAEQTIFA